MTESVRGHDGHASQTEQRQYNDADEKAGLQPKFELAICQQRIGYLFSVDITVSNVEKFARFFDGGVEIPIASEKVHDTRTDDAQGRC